jgi:hypothetical protein
MRAAPARRSSGNHHSREWDIGQLTSSHDRNPAYMRRKLWDDLTDTDLRGNLLEGVIELATR